MASKPKERGLRANQAPAHQFQAAKNESHILLTTPSSPHAPLVRRQSGSNSTFLDPISSTNSAVRPEDPDCPANCLIKVSVCSDFAPSIADPRCHKSTDLLIQPDFDWKPLTQNNTHVACSWQHSPCGKRTQLRQSPPLKTNYQRKTADHHNTKCRRPPFSSFRQSSALQSRRR